MSRRLTSLGVFVPAVVWGRFPEVGFERSICSGKGMAPCSPLRASSFVLSVLSILIAVLVLQEQLRIVCRIARNMREPTIRHALLFHRNFTAPSYPGKICHNCAPFRMLPRSIQMEETNTDPQFKTVILAVRAHDAANLPTASRRALPVLTTENSFVSFCAKNWITL